MINKYLFIHISLEAEEGGGSGGEEEISGKLKRGGKERISALARSAKVVKRLPVKKIGPTNFSCYIISIRGCIKLT